MTRGAYWVVLTSFVILAISCPSSKAEEFRAEFKPSEQGIPGLTWDQTKENLSPEIRMVEDASENSQPSSTAPLPSPTPSLSPSPEPTPTVSPFATPAPAPSGSPETEVHKELKLGHELYYVVLKGKFEAKDQNLILTDGTQIPLDSQNRFSIQVPIESDETRVKLTAIDPTGGIKSEEDRILIPMWTDFQSYRLQTQKELEHSSWLSLGARLGYVGISNTDILSGSTMSSGAPGVVITAQAQYPFHGRWRKYWLLEAQATGMASIPTAANRIYTFEGDVRVNYDWREIFNHWRVELLGMYSYQTSLPIPYTFAYENLHGATVFPRFKKQLSDNRTVSAQIWYMPFLASGALMSPFASFDFGLQGRASLFRFRSRWIDGLLDVRYLQIKYNTYAGGTFDLTQISAGIVYPF